MTTQTDQAPEFAGAMARPLKARRRSARLRRAAVQLAILAAALGLVILFALGVRQGLEHHGIGFSFDYLWNIAGIEISEGKFLTWAEGWLSLKSFDSTDTNGQALMAGLWNTLKVALVGILVSTVLGTLLGVGRLSTNYLARRLSFAIVEFIRNTPLLIQLMFWYAAVVLQFPPMSAAAELFGGLIASRQGIYLPAVVPSEAATHASAWGLVLGLLLLAAGIFRQSPRFIRLALVGGGLVGVLVSAGLGFPLAFDLPVANRFRASGGVNISPEMAALLLAISVNTAAYIAEIVRGASDAIGRGQWEAATALGLNRRDTLRDVILPQVFRVVLPSFGNQYITLAKNTSLGIAIGFPDLFNVNGTIANQTGRSLEGVLIVMAAYLLLSWTIGGMVNLLNSRLISAGGGR